MSGLTVGKEQMTKLYSKINCGLGPYKEYYARLFKMFCSAEKDTFFNFNTDSFYSL